MQLNPFLLLTVGLAGGVGSVLRYALASIQGWLPWGTLIANTVASAFAAGIVVFFDSASFLEVSLVAGLAGGLSTLSTYAGQTYEMLRKKRWAQAVTYTFASFVIPSTAVFALALFA
jgi:fluoride ion exporter CrcB/FEX